MKYLIEAGKPYAGHIISILQSDGTVAWTEGLTIAGYKRERGVQLQAIDEIQLRALTAEYEDSRKTEPEEITRARWHDMLEILPPSRWHDVGAWNVFHICERISGNLVSWFARKGDAAHVAWTDDANMTDTEILAKLED